LYCNFYIATSWSKENMKSATTGTISGCILGLIVFCLISSCLTPVAWFIGGFTSVTDFAMQTVGQFICPEGTSVGYRTYETTSTDQYGNRQPSTAYVLQCLEADGDVVQEDQVGYAFIWMGGLVVMGLILAGGLAFALAAPAGALIARFLNRHHTQ
jgi:hypothetical protein